MFSPEPGCLLVYIDDTGNETFRGQKTWGLGGVLMFPAEYESLLKPKWRELRKFITGSEDLPLHAADLGKVGHFAHMQAAGNFFSQNHFFRFGVGTSVEVSVPEVMTKRQPVYEMLKKYVVQAAERVGCTSIALIFESSQRGDATLQEEFGELVFAPNGAALPVHYCLMQKAAGEIGLEVADFVANATGGMLKTIVAGDRRFRADTCAVFHSVPDSIQRFMFVSTVVGRMGNEWAGGLELRSAVLLAPAICSAPVTAVPVSPVERDATAAVARGPFS